MERWSNEIVRGTAGKYRVETRIIFVFNLWIIRIEKYLNPGLWPKGRKTDDAVFNRVGTFVQNVYIFF